MRPLHPMQALQSPHQRTGTSQEEAGTQRPGSLSSGLGRAVTPTPQHKQGLYPKMQSMGAGFTAMPAPRSPKAQLGLAVAQGRGQQDSGGLAVAEGLGAEWGTLDW